MSILNGWNDSEVNDRRTLLPQFYQNCIVVFNNEFDPSPFGICMDTTCYLQCFMPTAGIIGNSNQ